MIPERLAALRQEMEKRDIAVYIVPTADFHESEYVGEYFKARRFITGFTGSAGTAVITRTKAGLWTDGRYFVQAAKQLEGTTVTLYRMGEEDVPTGVILYRSAVRQPVSRFSYQTPPVQKLNIYIMPQADQKFNEVSWFPGGVPALHEP